MIARSITRALSQMGDPRFRSVLLKGVGLAVALLAVFYAAFVTLVGWVTPEVVTIPFIGEVRWIDDLLSWGSILLMFVLSVFLMVPVASAMTGIFLEDVAAAVEDRYYPDQAPPGRIPFNETVRDTLSFLGLLIVANLCALVLYLLFAPLAPFIFWGLNGFLLGREYFTVAAMRRVGRRGAQEMRKRHFVTIWVAGALMAVPLTIPLVNLLVPILGAAVFTHLYHALAASRAA
ncbi:CysZ-like protein [Roseivivax sp. THAF40]|uniref:EI24 domain-containing protein n=1 Tax=unclassified Roseivivax TaxID=2639302 RepID=UPI001268FAFC|nr:MULTISPECIES: EI24 domain-containing protein [unclassified Roseivivax]QFS81304.1 CysZ-like protein [Roseivivax sp. THAF197b]QFT45033.1 CysZ-like protein [Roseivivax sp. THAF40]